MVRKKQVKVWNLKDAGQLHGGENIIEEMSWLLMFD